ncbi:hypothetical protein [Streptomyces halobius]|uniref:Ig-like domain-containing protein n=1 Tax=Streptomyces halobius TaxID=2879846 RepID=A0ABY4M284_9ACTN|nr:hypothetical protein [Streptomyces halobius]UQA91866.1 hypothetical protein K9S39_08370 [Streptomyces halobius]
MAKTGLRRIVVPLFTAPLMTGFLIGPGAAPAGAETAAETAACTGTQHLHFQPGLKLQTGLPNDPLPKVHVSTTGGAYSCTTPAVESMSVTTISVDVFASCVTSRDPKGTIGLKWPAVNKTSTIKVTSFAIENGPSSGSKVIVIGGTVQSGRFQNQSMTIQVTALASDTTKCASTQGLEDLTGEAKATFT